MPTRLPWAIALASAVLIAQEAPAQTQYYNLDGGRPGRVEDAESIARYSLGVDFAPFQLERLTDGTMRYRAEPKLAYGILPFTELEVRVPIVRVDPSRASGAQSTTGVASVAVGLLHAFNLETPSAPAIALGEEVTLPIGALAGPRASYLIKGLTTKTTGLGRWHFNGGAGTYSVRVAGLRPDSGCTQGTIRITLPLPGQQVCGGGPPIIFDSPCSVHPAHPGSSFDVRAMCMAAPPADTTASVSARTHGYRWLAGIGVDHAYALQSTLVTADLVAERFVGLYSRSDWTAETGLRHQVTPTLMVSGGIGWHFAGVIHSTLLNFGASYEFATAPLIGAGLTR